MCLITQPGVRPVNWQAALIAEVEGRFKTGIALTHLTVRLNISIV
jgi:hypothetical protein